MVGMPPGAHGNLERMLKMGQYRAGFGLELELDWNYALSSD